MSALADVNATHAPDAITNIILLRMMSMLLKILLQIFLEPNQNYYVPPARGGSNLKQFKHKGLPEEYQNEYAPPT